MKNNTEHIRNFFLAVLFFGLILWAASGCATYSKTTTYSLGQNGQTNSITVTEKGRTDPLLTKVVEQDVNGSGVDLDFFGIANYFSPFKLKFGNFNTIYRSIPTSIGTIASAPYNVTAHDNSSIIQHAGDDNVSTSTNLPNQAFIGPNVQVLNPEQPVASGTGIASSLVSSNTLPAVRNAVAVPSTTAISK